jgi:hypothetical protein
MAHGWNGEMSLAIRLKNNSRGKVKEIQKEAGASYPSYHRNPQGETFAK